MSTSTSLYLDFQLDDETGANAMTALSAAIAAAPIASVLLRPVGTGHWNAGTVRQLIGFAQKKDIAVLVPADIDGVADLGADGFHLSWSADIVRAFKNARASWPNAIIGADAGRSRHDAMELGEAGADYVAFGIPPHVEDRAKATERQLDLVEWWSEVFEVPCVAFDVPECDIARALAAAGAGADFVSVHVSSSDTEQSAAARVRAFLEALHTQETTE
ncbi:MAG: thiamine phosphate synthase [Hyphomicrobium sp.]|uniref:thiamine phosphate synthase n=1 Tax=Hyphomicrobium sp. TaxID=82 RepID=UPI0039E62E2D